MPSPFLIAVRGIHFPHRYMSVPAFLLAAILAAAAPADCPTPYGEQHRYVPCYEAMLRDAEAKNDPAGEAQALMQLAWAAWQTSNFEQARQRFERAAQRSVLQPIGRLLEVR